FEAHQCLREGVLVVELRRAVQRQLRGGRQRECGCNDGEQQSGFHGFPSSLTVMRHSVRGSCGSVSVAECSSEALSQITTSPTPYFRRSWYFSCVAWRASPRSNGRASSSAMPSTRNEVPLTA